MVANMHAYMNIGQNLMDNQETHASLDTRHTTHKNEDKQSKKN